jgi:tRNA (guanine-N7-)-methyltransferase
LRKNGYAIATRSVKESAHLQSGPGPRRARAPGAIDGARALAYAAPFMVGTTREDERDEGPQSPAERYRALAPRAPEQGLVLTEVFPSSTEIEMEIGFGRGMFLLQRAERAPGSGLLGIEIKDKLAVRVAERVAKRRLERVRVLAGDARAVVARLGPDRALARVWMHFPDPWWKKRHAKRRLLDASLLDELARLLRAQGELFVQTDVEERAQAFLEEIGRHGAFVLPPGGFTTENPYGAVSNREARAIQDGLPIYRILARRTD